MHCKACLQASAGQVAVPPPAPPCPHLPPHCPLLATPLCAMPQPRLWWWCARSWLCCMPGQHCWCRRRRCCGPIPSSTATSEWSGAATTCTTIRHCRPNSQQPGHLQATSRCTHPPIPAPAPTCTEQAPDPIPQARAAALKQAGGPARPRHAARPVGAGGVAFVCVAFVAICVASQKITEPEKLH